MAITTKPASYATIEFEGGSVSVRALRTTEIGMICRDVAGDIAGLFDRSFQADPRAMLADQALVHGLMSALLARGPQLIGKTIALAADVPDQIDDVIDLPIDVQAAALERILALTFTNPASFAAAVRGIGDLASRQSAAISAVRQ